MMRVLFRIIAGFLSAYSLVLFGTIFWRFELSRHFSEVVLPAWLVAWIILEIVTAFRKQNALPRLLTHLRYAPIAILVFSLCTVLAYDGAMILHSRWMIRQYVYGNASPTQQTRLKLYNHHRGWCGNGYSAAIYDNYADTAAEGFESTDPAVRARSLQMSIQVFDWLNGVTDGPFPELIVRASHDSDPLVRQLALDFRSHGYGVER